MAEFEHFLLLMFMFDKAYYTLLCGGKSHLALYIRSSINTKSGHLFSEQITEPRLKAMIIHHKGAEEATRKKEGRDAREARESYTDEDIDSDGQLGLKGPSGRVCT